MFPHHHIDPYTQPPKPTSASRSLRPAILAVRSTSGRLLLPLCCGEQLCLKCLLLLLRPLTRLHGCLPKAIASPFWLYSRPLCWPNEGVTHADTKNSAALRLRQRLALSFKTPTVRPPFLSTHIYRANNLPLLERFEQVVSHFDLLYMDRRHYRTFS